jgi:hypothetical protein
MRNNEEIILLRKIDRKLGLMLGNQIVEKYDSIKEQVTKLSRSGLDYNEIAEILAISPSHAAKELSKIKKVNKNVR